MITLNSEFIVAIALRTILVSIVIVIVMFVLRGRHKRKKRTLILTRLRLHNFILAILIGVVFLFLIHVMFYKLVSEIYLSSLVKQLNRADKLQIHHSFIDWSVYQGKKEEITITDPNLIDSVADLVSATNYEITLQWGMLRSSDRMMVDIYHNETEIGWFSVRMGYVFSTKSKYEYFTENKDFLNDLRRALGLRGILPKDFSFDPNQVRRILEARAAEDSLQEPNNTQ